MSFLFLEDFIIVYLGIFPYVRVQNLTSQNYCKTASPCEKSFVRWHEVTNCCIMSNYYSLKSSGLWFNFKIALVCFFVMFAEKLRTTPPKWTEILFKFQVNLIPDKLISDSWQLVRLPLFLTIYEKPLIVIFPLFWITHFIAAVFLSLTSVNAGLLYVELWAGIVLKECSILVFHSVLVLQKRCCLTIFLPSNMLVGSRCFLRVEQNNE